MAALKDEISPALVEALAAELRSAWPAFPRERFVDRAASGLEELELLARVSHVAQALGECLPSDFANGAAILDRALASQTLTGWMALPCGEWVAAHGLAEPDVALPLLARLTPRFSSEFAIRPFVERHPEITFRHLRQWAEDADEHVRRLVSEGTRPRLPWAAQLRDLRADPGPMLGLLERLSTDESEYVRRSVANHLNDISKDHPELAVSLAERWQARGAEGVVRHGLRSLVKQGDPQALRLVGYDPDVRVTLADLSAAPARVRIGEATEISFTLAAKDRAPLVIHYRVHHAGVRAQRSAKAFKLGTCAIEAGERRRFTQRHEFRELSVRRIHPGKHPIEIQVNGRVLGAVEVDVA